GRKYFWQVVARDQSGNKSTSAIFSFTVLSDSEVDSTPPAILGVSPENGAIAVSGDSAVRVIFSEPVDQNSALEAFSFSPAVSGAWSWENDATARFWPSPAWLPGSYNRLIIADNKVKDKNNNIMSRGASYNFTIASDLPLPSGCRSTGFPVMVQANQTFNVSVPELVAGARSYAVAVASPDPASFSLRSNMRQSLPADIDPHSAFRFFESQLTAQLPAAVLEGRGGLRASAVPLSLATVGESEEFFIPEYGQVATSTPYPMNRLNARCVAIGEGVIIYVDSSIQTPSSSLIADLRQRFEEVIQPRIRDVFGDEPASGPDGETRLTILLTDSMTLGIAGIFYGIDLYGRDESNIQLRESNERKMIYVKYSLANSVTRFGTIAHEFQHMVNFYQKQRLGGAGNYEAVWLNEGLSKYAEEVCGYGILQGDSNTAELIKLSQQNLNDLSLTSFSGLNSYGLSYLFVRFLAQENRFGTTYREITRGLIGSSLTGKANVEAVTGENFRLTLAKWAISLYLNRYQSVDAQEYGFSGLNLAGVHNGVSLPGFVPLDARTEQGLNLKADAVRAMVKISTGEAETSFKLLNGQNSFYLWQFDFRP
ncbi:MAG: Ig-like domain-containing protein, partial [Candidatus Riflebacteria bacterium]|nr:Ig-like domain-containing protein [Candidatus Riflebacteria bacterium]